MNEVDKVFTKEDNEKIMTVPNKEEIKTVLQALNSHAAPGSDGLTNYFYLKCFHIIGDTLVDVIQAIFKFEKPSIYQITCQMVFANKPNKPNSTNYLTKRKLAYSTQILKCWQE